MRERDNSGAEALITRLATLFAERPETVAIALGGSRAGIVADPASDIDLYVLTSAGIPLPARAAIVAQSGGASRADLGLAYWGPGDEWFDAATGIEVDIVYFDFDWLAGELRQVLRERRAAMGYTTCYWHTIRMARPLYDPTGRLSALRAECEIPYPEALRRNIIALNHPVLREIIPAYAVQIEKAVKRADWVSVNHRLAALLASYFDILFALNRVPHPGEKRMLAQAEALCARLPVDMAADVSDVLATAAGPELLGHLHRLLDRLDDIMQKEEND